jgi:hypothetical protein
MKPRLEEFLKPWLAIIPFFQFSGTACNLIGASNVMQYSLPQLLIIVSQETPDKSLHKPMVPFLHGCSSSFPIGLIGSGPDG